VRRRLAVLRHVEEVTGNVTMTARFSGSAAKCTTRGCAATALRDQTVCGSARGGQVLSTRHAHRGRRQDYSSAGELSLRADEDQHVHLVDQTFEEAEPLVDKVLERTESFVEGQGEG
jgi:hypothetical protein